MRVDDGIAKKKLLVFGGSGYVGRHLLHALGTQRALGTYFQHPFPGGVRFDPDRTRVADLLQKGDSFSHALLLLNSGSIDSVATHRQTAHLANVTNLIDIIDQLFTLGIKPVFASSDAVFDGTKGNYTEEDARNPLLVYGVHKAIVEEYLQQQPNPNYLIVRLSKVYGVARHDRTLFTQWVDDIQNGTPLRLAWDQRFSPVFVEDVVAGLLALIHHDLSGLFHLSGPESFSRVELFGLLTARLRDRFGDIPQVPIQICRINDLNFVETRPIDCSMNSSKLVRAVGLSLHSAASCCQTLVDSLPAWPPR
ncbi:MAG: sugar nucleotide-binding protein [Magnetococcus sp. YQC-3]